MFGLGDAVWQQFEDRWLALSHVKRTGLEADFTIKSSPEFITGAGVDSAAAYQFAVEVVKSYHEENELLDLAESYFKSMPPCADTSDEQIGIRNHRS